MLVVHPCKNSREDPSMGLMMLDFWAIVYFFATEYPFEHRWCEFLCLKHLNIESKHAFISMTNRIDSIKLGFISYSECVGRWIISCKCLVIDSLWNFRWIFYRTAICFGYIFCICTWNVKSGQCATDDRFLVLSDEAHICFGSHEIQIFLPSSHIHIYFNLSLFRLDFNVAIYDFIH